MSEASSDRYIREISTTDQPAEEPTDLLTQAVEAEGELNSHAKVNQPKPPKQPPKEHEKGTE